MAAGLRVKRYFMEDRKKIRPDRGVIRSIAPRVIIPPGSMRAHWGIENRPIGCPLSSFMMISSAWEPVAAWRI
jgi:hypothetical protein